MGVVYTAEPEVDEFTGEESEYGEGVMTTSLPLGAVGWSLAVVGSGLALGGLLRVSWSATNLKSKRPLGSLIAGWILWGLNIAGAVVMAALEPDLQLLNGPHFIPHVSLSAITLLIVAIGYAAGWSSLQEGLAKEKAEEEMKKEKEKEKESGVTLMPSLVPVRGGAMAGLTIVF